MSEDELEQLRADNERLRQENAALRAMGQSLSSLEMVNSNELWCPYCHNAVVIPKGRPDRYAFLQEIKHEPDCPVTHFRALIAKS